MKFCEKCDFMYYIGIDKEDPNKLTYYCRQCGHIDNILTTEGLCVLKTDLKKGEQKFNHIVNPYTKMDPTLPRINHVKCPNGGCATNVDGIVPEIIFMRYDDANLKYVYICSTCDVVWKTDNDA